MNKPVPAGSASAFIDERIKEFPDWRGRTLAKVRDLIHEADPEIVEEWKWRRTPVWSRGGIVCTGETYKQVVKMTFANGAKLEDPSGLFNASLEGNVRRAIDIHEGDTLDEAALKDLIRAAVELNLSAKAARVQLGRRRPTVGTRAGRQRHAPHAVAQHRSPLYLLGRGGLAHLLRRPGSAAGG